MALNNGGGAGQNRRPSNYGLTVSRVWRGIEVQQKWPKPSGKKRHPATKERNEFFRQVQWAWKFANRDLRQAYTEAVAGTPLLPRDLFLSAMAGRLLAFRLPTGELIVPVTAQTDVSGTLDFLSSVPGSILVRGPDGWVGLLPGEADQVLTMDPDGIGPMWREGGSGGDVKRELVPKPDASMFTLNTAANWVTVNSCVFMAAITEGETELARLKIPVVSCPAGTTFQPVLYSLGPGEQMPSVTTGATFLASGPAVAFSGRGVIDLPFTDPMILGAGYRFLIGALKGGVAGTVGVHALTANRTHFGSVVLSPTIPPSLPAIAGTSSVLAAFWTEGQ